MRLLSAAAVSLTALALVPGSAAAAPPVNDNYLASLPITPQAETVIQVDTTEAGTQPDLFNPNAAGQPLGGGPAETTTCNGVAFGKTVWYDFAPPVNYGVQLRATGFATAIAVYEWEQATSRIVRTVGCSGNAAGEDLLLDLEGRKNYTIQVGGVGGVGGALTLRMDAFPDGDGDGVLDALDKCAEVPGIERGGGCPPSLRGKVVPSFSYVPSGTGIKIVRLALDSVPKGAKVTARCPGCGSQTVTAKRLGRVTLSRLVGRTVSAGRKFTIRVTLGETGTGTYRFGATGSLFEWPVANGKLGRRVTKCLAVRTAKVERCS